MQMATLTRSAALSPSGLVVGPFTMPMSPVAKPPYADMSIPNFAWSVGMKDLWCKLLSPDYTDWHYRSTAPTVGIGHALLGDVRSMYCEPLWLQQIAETKKEEGRCPIVWCRHVHSLTSALTTSHPSSLASSAAFVCSTTMSACGRLLMSVAASLSTNPIATGTS